MGIFDRAKDTATTRPGSANQDTVVDAGSRPADPDVTGTAVGTDQGSVPQREEGAIGSESDQSADADV